MLVDSNNIISFPVISDLRGNLSFLENNNHVPFEIKRVYWIYDVPGGETRGGHAFINQKEVIIALSGSFDVILNNGKQLEKVHLNRSYYGLFIANGIWRHMENFSTNALALVVSSTFYDEKDYIRDFDEFKQWKNEQ